ncbi:signal transducer and activator of transcription 2 isoform X2 [Ambystoma mexicanum]|uniref:signal transducer and activator of transcription 2 isoform X2 n=1 Tax=Ambystoma mexicanum TaxID=8296 RepID=UPI0037E74008
MTQWDVLKSLDTAYLEQVQDLYSLDRLPMDLRQFLAEWIESQDWNLAKRDPQVARVTFQNLLEHLNNQYSRFSHDQAILEQHNIRKIKQDIQACYQESPTEFAKLILFFLEKERNIISAAKDAEQSLTEQTPHAILETPRHKEIEQRVMEVKQKVQAIDQDVKSLEEQQEIFDFRYKNYQAQVSSNQAVQHQLKNVLQSMLNTLDRSRKEILARLKELLGRCETLVRFLEEELGEWCQRQQDACIGRSLDVSLSHLETWFTGTAEAFFQLRRILNDLVELPAKISYENDPLRTDPVILQARVNELITCLLKRAFVVEDQPNQLYQPCMSPPWPRPLVLRTSVRFSVSTRLLVKLQELNHSLKVTAAIDNNAMTTKGYRKFNIMGTLDKMLSMDNVLKKGMVAEFKHLTLKEQRAGVGGKGSKGINEVLVTEELHVMNFTVKFKYQDLELELEATTLPLVIISNVGQQSSAWASVIWFNLLATDTKNLAFFSNPPAATWARLANALSWQFSCATNRGLDSEQLSMLAEKLCGTNPKPRPESLVKWSRFSKESMPGLAFSFWTWFDGVLHLVKAHLENIWNDGYVMGFVCRATERSLLKRKRTGTFLLRFSESCKEGAVTFSWVDHQETDKPTVRSVQPYTKQDLANIPFVEILHSYQILADENIPENTLLYLYPDTPKDEAFSKYYLSNNRENIEEYRKYMKRRLIMISERPPDMMPPLQLNEGEDMEPTDIEIPEPPDFSVLSLMTGPDDPMMPVFKFENGDDLY